MDRSGVLRWVADYERAWRERDTGGVERFADFEEWPFWPGRPYAATD